jgi:hypothetical protein
VELACCSALAPESGDGVTAQRLRDEVADLVVGLCDDARRPVRSGVVLVAVVDRFGVSEWRARAAVRDVVFDGRLRRLRVFGEVCVAPRLMVFPALANVAEV